MKIALIMLISAFTGAAAFAMATPAAGAYQPPGAHHLSVAERQQCEHGGGRIMVAGLSGGDMCVHRTRDAGHRCTSSSQCQTSCEYAGRARAGSRAIGRCQADDYPFSCHTRVEGGRVQSTLCVD
jgi:hypothetical protein